MRNLAKWYPLRIVVHKLKEYNNSIISKQDLPEHITNDGIDFRLKHEILELIREREKRNASKNISGDKVRCCKVCSGSGFIIK